MLIINNKEFAEQHQSINDTIDIATLERVQDLFDELSGSISFTITGDMDNTNRAVLNVAIYGKITSLCQNCLEKMEIILEHTAVLPIFDNESDLDDALFSEESTESDGLIADLEFDVLNFIEDEIIILLPLAPKHGNCKQSSHKNDSSNPFGVLKQLLN